jgi:hypothetical protein
LGFGGTAGADRGAAEHFIGEAKKRFRPEFFNRIDHIVPFAPLSPEHLRLIVAKELDGLRRRDGIRERHLSLELEPELIDRILERGYDPRYGARPLRRQLGIEVLRRVAENLNESTRERGEVRVGIGEIRYTKVPGPSLGKQSPELETVAVLRRKFQRLSRASFVSELNSEKFRLDRVAAQHRRNRATGDDVKAVFARREVVDGLLKSLEKKASAMLLREEMLLLEQSGHGTADNRRANVTEEDYEQLLLSLYAAAERTPQMLLLVFQADEPAHLFNVVEDYFGLAENLDCDCRLGAYLRKPLKEHWDEAKAKVRPRVIDPGAEADFLAQRDEETVALALELRGPLAYLWFRGETGGHEFELDDRGGKKKYRLVVHPLEGPLEEAWFDGEKLRQTALRGAPVHRRYNLIRGTWKDDLMGTSGHDYYSYELLERIVRQRLITEAERAL